MESLAQQIKIAIEHSQYGALYMEDIIGEKLRLAAMVAQKSLDPDVENVTNEELEELSKKIGISYITLFVQAEDDIVGWKSNDPKEINLSTKEWTYWYEAFQQLFAHHNVDDTIPEGQRLPNYWAGPMAVSSSDPEHVDKWGYYYDGTTNYIINPYVRDKQVINFTQEIGPESIVKKTLENNQHLLEITGINPNAFGNPPIYTELNGNRYIDLFNQEIQFGTYDYQDQNDLMSVKKAFASNQTVSYTTTINDTDVLKSFIPVEAKHPYVISLVIDYGIIQDVLNKQLFHNITNSIIVLIIVFFGSYFLAGYIVRPLNHIFNRVGEVAKGNYDAQLTIDRNDELGKLSEQVNMMSRNLKNYKKTEEMLLRSEKLSLAGQLAAGVAHEIRNPLTSIQGFVQLLQEKDYEHKDYLQIIDSELKRIELIVSEFLVLAKPQVCRFKKVNVCDIIIDVTRLLETHANMSRIQILTHFEKDEVVVECDENQLKQLFINVTKNAIEAMPHGGEINIYISKQQDNHILLRFVDQGCGIPKESISRLGEPFYTTKEDGTGLGLMICHKIVENHHGNISVSSLEGEGTMIDIYLPKTQVVKDHE